MVFEDEIKEQDGMAVMDMLRRASIDIDINRINRAGEREVFVSFNEILKYFDLCTTDNDELNIWVELYCFMYLHSVLRYVSSPPGSPGQQSCRGQDTLQTR